MKGIADVSFRLDPRSVALGGVLGALLGAGGGYLVARRVLGRQFDERLDAEVAAVKAHYNGHLKSLLQTGRPYTGPVRDEGPSTIRGYPSFGFTPGDAGGIDSDQPALFEELSDGPEVDELEGSVGDDQALAAQPVRHGVDRPHIISVAEFSETEVGWQQVAITWYSGDGVLVDDKEQPIRDVNMIIGTTPVKAMFGNESGDPSIMFIRNPRLEIDFEVVWDDRAYVDVVLNYGSPK